MGGSTPLPRSGRSGDAESAELHDPGTPQQRHRDRRYPAQLSPAGAWESRCARRTGTASHGDPADRLQFESRGFGSAGLQAALPASIHPVPALVFHLNAGVTWLPNAKNPSGREASTTSYNLGASAIWLAKSRINFLMEWVWLDAELVNANGGTRREQAMLLNPGVRVGFDFKSGLQIVPGVAYTVGVGPSEDVEALFLYLSFRARILGSRWSVISGSYSSTPRATSPAADSVPR